MKDKTLATFKIDSDKWEAFMQKANDSGSNASAALKQFIDAYMGGYRIPESAIDDSPTLGGFIDDRLDVRLAPILQELAELRSYVLMNTAPESPAAPRVEITADGWKVSHHQSYQVWEQP